MQENYKDECLNEADKFLKTLISHVKDLSKVPQFLDLFSKYENIGAYECARKQAKLINKMETGQVKKEDEETVEIQLICCSLVIAGYCSGKMRKIYPDLEKEENKRRNI